MSADDWSAPGAFMRAFCYVPSLLLACLPSPHEPSPPIILLIHSRPLFEIMHSILLHARVLGHRATTVLLSLHYPPPPPQPSDDDHHVHHDPCQPSLTHAIPHWRARTPCKRHGASAPSCGDTPAAVEPAAAAAFVLHFPPWVSTSCSTVRL